VRARRHWCSQSRRLVIRRNESFANRTASSTDGGGFGLTGLWWSRCWRTTSRTINDGPGFLLAQYFGARPFRDNSVVGNSSVNDARHNDCGAIQVWAAEDHGIKDCLIERNSVQLEGPRRRPRALLIQGRTQNLTVRGNRFSCRGIPTIYEIDPLQRDFIFQDNQLESVEVGRSAPVD